MKHAQGTTRVLFLYTYVHACMRTHINQYIYDANMHTPKYAQTNMQRNETCARFKQECIAAEKLRKRDCKAN
jgi:hypothetical protein